VTRDAEAKLDVEPRGRSDQDRDRILDVGVWNSDRQDGIWAVNMRC
jgi:hypothetical protein